MKLRREKQRYKIPPHSEILGVRVEGNQKHNQMWAYVIQQISLVEMSGMLTKHLAMPTYFAVAPEQINFYPIPDKAYTVKVRYLPPVQEF